LGAAKLLGAAVNAGITFDLGGATYSHLAHGDAAAELVLPIALLVLTALSYYLLPDSRRLTAARPLAV
jgi:hypothetical protein